MNSTKEQLGYKLAVLKDRKGDLSKRWYIEFSITETGTEELIRKFKFCPVSYKTAVERRAWASEYISIINAALIDGYVLPNRFLDEDNEFNKEKRLKLVLEAFDYAISIKHLETRTRTAHAYNSFRNIFREFLEEKGFLKIPLSIFIYNDAGKVHKKYVYLFRDYLLRERNNKPATVNNMLSFMKTIFNTLVDRGVIKDNPAKGVSQLKCDIGRNIAFSDAEVALLKEEISTRDPELYLFICFIYYCGVRKDEIRKLKIENIEDTKLYVPAEISKTANARFHTIPRPMEELIKKHNLRVRPKDEYIFYKVRGHRKFITAYNHFYNRHKAFLREFKFGPEYTMHSWRHTFACKAVNTGIHVEFIRQQLGHASLEMTLKYLKSLGLVENEEIKNNFPEM